MFGVVSCIVLHLGRLDHTKTSGFFLCVSPCEPILSILSQLFIFGTFHMPVLLVRIVFAAGRLIDLWRQRATEVGCSEAKRFANDFASISVPCYLTNHVLLNF